MWVHCICRRRSFKECKQQMKLVYRWLALEKISTEIINVCAILNESLNYAHTQTTTASWVRVEKVVSAKKNEKPNKDKSSWFPSMKFITQYYFIWKYVALYTLVGTTHRILEKSDTIVNLIPFMKKKRCGIKWEMKIFYGELNLTVKIFSKKFKNILMVTIFFKKNPPKKNVYS